MVVCVCTYNVGFIVILDMASFFTALWSAMHVFKVRTWIQYESQQTGQFVLFFDLATFFATFSNSVDMSVRDIGRALLLISSTLYTSKIII